LSETQRRIDLYAQLDEARAERNSHFRHDRAWSWRDRVRQFSSMLSRQFGRGALHVRRATCDVRCSSEVIRPR
jgi:hypothetical protein